MTEPRELYDALAGLLCYPGPGYVDRLDECRRALEAVVPEAAERVGHVADRLRGLSDEDIEELYTRTFDLSPVCSLEVGWHLFGENYARGEFLVRMRQELRDRGLAESAELPDHLTHVLPALARMGRKEADRFASRFLLPALEKMLAGLARQENPYPDLLEAVRGVVLSPYTVATQGSES
jgi:nitrate reductase molybdenum cofactor assembly chaperone